MVKIYNLQGDVVALIDANGTQVVEYGYDAWGNPISKTGSLAATIGTLNPFRYRGYVYDEETGLYYLRSRYYNLIIRKYLNADILLGEQLPLQHNTYSYCVNSQKLMRMVVRVHPRCGQRSLLAFRTHVQSLYIHNKR